MSHEVGIPDMGCALGVARPASVIQVAFPWRVQTSMTSENIVAPGFSNAGPVTKSWMARRPPGASTPASRRVRA